MRARPEVADAAFGAGSMHRDGASCSSAGLFSGVLSVVQTCTSLYTLAVYDWALPASDLGALAALTGTVVALHLVFCLLDLARGWVIAQAGLCFARRLESRALFLFEADRRRGLAALGDVGCVARYLSSAGPAALLDAIWLPASFVVIAHLHPALALFACAGAVGLLAMASKAEKRVRGERHAILDLRRRCLSDGAFPASGAKAGCRRRTRALSRCYYRRCAAAARTALVAAAAAKAARLCLQSAGFGLGALLVIEGTLGVGGLFAWSLVANRLFASLDAVLAHSQGFAAARESYRRLAAAGVAEEIRALGGSAKAAQILNSSMLAKAVRSASDQAPESFLK